MGIRIDSLTRDRFARDVDGTGIPAGGRRLALHSSYPQERDCAHHARARSLAEGLGQLSKTDTVLPTRRDAQGTSLRAGGPILYYLLGTRQSYLWAITARKTSVFQLPPASELDTDIRRYRKALETQKNLAESQNPDGLALYQMLVAPALSTLAKASRVFIIADGTLNALNFEALLVPDPTPH